MGKEEIPGYVLNNRVRNDRLRQLPNALKKIGIAQEAVNRLGSTYYEEEQSKAVIYVDPITVQGMKGGVMGMIRELRDLGVDPIFQQQGKEVKVVYKYERI